MAPKQNPKWVVKTRTLQLVQSTREFTWDPGGQEKLHKQSKLKCLLLELELCLWILKILINLCSKVSKEDEKPHKSKTNNMANEMPVSNKRRLKLHWQRVLNHTTFIIFNKITYKYTHTGSLLLRLNNKLKIKHTLVFFIGFTDWIGEIKPTSLKGSENNKLYIGDSYILQVRAQMPTWNIAMSVDGDGLGPPHHPPDTVKTKHSERLLGVNQLTLNDSAYWPNVQIYLDILWSLTLKKALSVDGDGFEPPHHPPDTFKDWQATMLGVSHSTLNGTVKTLGLHFYDYSLWSTSVREKEKLVDGYYPGPPNDLCKTTHSMLLKSLQGAAHLLETLSHTLGLLCFLFHMLWSWVVTAKNSTTSKLVDLIKSVFHTHREIKISRDKNDICSKLAQQPPVEGKTAQTTGERNTIWLWASIFAHSVKLTLKNFTKMHKARSSHSNLRRSYISSGLTWSVMPCLVTSKPTPEDWSFGIPDPRKLVFWDFLANNLWVFLTINPLGKPKKVWSFARAPKIFLTSHFEKTGVFKKMQRLGQFSFYGYPR